MLFKYDYKLCIVSFISICSSHLIVYLMFSLPNNLLKIYHPIHRYPPLLFD
ncbi:hypothetical protein BCN_2597 [Bacillus cereus NC7401]|nr:hypothetical protein BCN_2597 [Bacillus cereus NC7401]